MTKQAAFFCRVCQAALPLAQFSPSRVRRCDHICRLHARRRLARGKPGPYELIARQVAARERSLGVRPAFRMSAEAVRQLVEDRFGRVSSLSGCRLEPGNLTLARADPAQPFSPGDNCALLSRSELRLRSLLAATPTLDGHAEALQAMVARAQEAAQ